MPPEEPFQPATPHEPLSLVPGESPGEFRLFLPGDAGHVTGHITEGEGGQRVAELDMIEMHEEQHGGGARLMLGFAAEAARRGATEVRADVINPEALPRANTVGGAPAQYSYRKSDGTYAPLQVKETRALLDHLRRQAAEYEEAGASPPDFAPYIRVVIDVSDPGVRQRLIDRAGRPEAVPSAEEVPPAASTMAAAVGEATIQGVRSQVDQVLDELRQARVALSVSNHHFVNALGMLAGVGEGSDVLPDIWELIAAAQERLTTTFEETEEVEQRLEEYEGNL